MFSIQKFFARDDRFFELLTASAEECRTSVRALKNILKSDGPDHSLDPFSATRLKDKQITMQINELLARSSVTILDPEDIEAISSVLYKIPKTVERFAERYMISRSELDHIDFSRQIILVEQATDTAAALIKGLEKSLFAQVTQHAEHLQQIEADADKLQVELLKELYNGMHPPLRVIIVKDLYELLEKIVDRCRDVSNVVKNVVLKHS
jgi:uncharacterized protein